MATKQEKINFVKAVYPAAQELQHKSLGSALFITAQAACETGYSLRGSGRNNILGITKGSWKGSTTLCRTTEYFRRPDVKFASPERVESIEYRADKGDYKYRVYRLFRDYDSIADCLEDHSQLRQKGKYVQYWSLRMDARAYAEAIAPIYATATNYATVLITFLNEVERIIKENGL